MQGVSFKGNDSNSWTAVNIQRDVVGRMSRCTSAQLFGCVGGWALDELFRNPRFAFWVSSTTG